VAADHTRPKNTLSTKPTPFCTLLPSPPPGGNESSIKRRYQCVTSDEFSLFLSLSLFILHYRVIFSLLSLKFSSSLIPFFVLSFYLILSHSLSFSLFLSFPIPYLYFFLAFSLILSLRCSLEVLLLVIFFDRR